MRSSWARVLAAGAVVASGLSLAACTSVRDSLGTHDSPCFRVLPEASLAVGRLGTYQGVRYVSANSLVSDIRHTYGEGALRGLPAPIVAAEHISVCLVEYRGDYHLADLDRGWSPSGETTAPYAVVVLRQSDGDVLATVLLRKQPLRFSRSA